MFGRRQAMADSSLSTNGRRLRCARRVCDQHDHIEPRRRQRPRPAFDMAAGRGERCRVIHGGTLDHIQLSQLAGLPPEHPSSWCFSRLRRSTGPGRWRPAHRRPDAGTPAEPAR
jgi:hypothetical protein